VSQIDLLLSDSEGALDRVEDESEFYYAQMLSKRASYYGANSAKHEAFTRDKKARVVEWARDLSDMSLEHHGSGMTLQSLMVAEIMASYGAQKQN
jgi:hypothetical protein